MITESFHTSDKAQYDLLRMSVSMSHLALLEKGLRKHLDKRIDCQIENGQTALSLHNPRLESLPNQLESLELSLVSPFPADVKRLGLLKGHTQLKEPFHIIEAVIDGNAWVVALGDQPEGFCGCGSTLPEALRALADDLEKEVS